MNIYVGNLNFQTTERELESAFASYGEVQSARLAVDRDTNRPRGFGFVEMANQTDAENAIAGLNCRVAPSPSTRPVLAKTADPVAVATVAAATAAEATVAVAAASKPDPNLESKAETQAGFRLLCVPRLSPRDPWSNEMGDPRPSRGGAAGPTTSSGCESRSCSGLLSRKRLSMRLCSRISLGLAGSFGTPLEDRGNNERL